MPLFKCTKCHHEWETTWDHSKFGCDWCHNKEEPIVLLTETQFEKFVYSLKDIYSKKRLPNDKE
jgi:protein-arginine kinase activator protein McsA